MTKDEKEIFSNLVEKLIKENLSVKLTSDSDYYSNGFRVTVYYDGKEVSTDTYNLPSDHYN